MFHLWINGKTVFKIEDKTKFYCQSLSELQTLSHLEATLKNSTVLKANPSDGQNYLQKTVHTDLCQFQVGQYFSIYCNAAHGGFCQLLYCMLFCWRRKLITHMGNGHISKSDHPQVTKNQEGMFSLLLVLTPALCKWHIHPGILSNFIFGWSQILAFRVVAGDFAS